MTGCAPLRVAVVYDCLYPYTTGGGERVYTELAARLRDRGESVEYLTRVQWEGRPPAEPFTVIPIWRGDIADASGDRRPGAALGFAWAVFRALLARRGRYDIVVVSALPPLNVFAARAALLGTASWLVGDWLEVWSARKWREYSGPVVGRIAHVLQSVGLRSTHEVTVNSEFTLARAQPRLRQGAGVVLGLVDLAGTTTALRGEGPIPEAPFVLFAGRHIADKQLEALPAAMAVVRREFPGVRLLIAGSGPETGTLRAAAVQHGETVELLGRVPAAELDALLASAAVLVNPSRREGFGLIVAEASAHGTPSVVVAGEDNASADLVQDGVNGFVAASTSPEDLGRALVRAIAGGAELRASTSAWFSDARIRRGLNASIDELLRRYADFRTR